MAWKLRSAILLAAGRGTRLGALSLGTPKPLIEIAGVPLIAHIVGALAEAGIERFIIVTGYLGDQVEAWAQTYRRRATDCVIETVNQRNLIGTAAALLASREKLESECGFVFGWGDVLMDRANYKRFIARAAEDDFDLLLAANRTRDPSRGGAVYLAADMRVLRIVEKPKPGESTTQWNNAGLFAATPLIFDYASRLSPSPRGELELPQAIAAMIDAGLNIRALDMRGFWIDIGTPEDLEHARRHFRPRRTG